MSDVNDAVETFLRNADSVYREYEKGYTDADASLSLLEHHIEDLRDAYED